MSEMEDLQKQVTPFIKEFLENEKMKQLDIIVTGKSEKGEGYLGEIIFVTVTGVNGSNKKIDLNLVLKIGKKIKIMREKFFVRDVYLREIFIYDKVFPAFQKFQRDRGAKAIFNSVPKCYKTIVHDDVEVLIFENLKSRGFELHDRQIPMNDAHIKFVLNTYAQFHAISFSMRDLDKDAFEKLMNESDIPFKKMLMTDDVKLFYDGRLEEMKKLLKENDEELAKLFSKIFEKGGYQTLIDLVYSDVQELVITHGDCWNNNMMFKYENDNKQAPTEVAVLDWQISCVHSPVLDLSYFLYIVSGEKVTKIEEYLKYYHTKLSKYITEMGSDPEKMFPFATLMKHWHKYSSYGILMLVSALQFMLCDKDEAPDMEDFDKSGQTMDVWSSQVKPKNQTEYKSRALTAIKYYCQHFKNSEIE